MGGGGGGMGLFIIIILRRGAYSRGALIRGGALNRGITVVTFELLKPNLF